DAGQIEKLAGELKPQILAAIEKLPRVKVPREDLEAVAENVARGVHASLADFISLWQQIEAVVIQRLDARGVKVQRVPDGTELARYQLVDSETAESYERMRRIRNLIVHG